MIHLAGGRLTACGQPLAEHQSTSTLADVTCKGCQYTAALRQAADHPRSRSRWPWARASMVRDGGDD